jgi:hypothetical protein
MSSATLGAMIFQFLLDCIQWLDNWEKHVSDTGNRMKKFLSPSTSAGLRVTLTSTIQLSERLLTSGYHYVLTAKLSQDPLEV